MPPGNVSPDDAEQRRSVVDRDVSPGTDLRHSDSGGADGAAGLVRAGASGSERHRFLVDHKSAVELDRRTAIARGDRGRRHCAAFAALTAGDEVRHGLAHR